MENKGNYKENRETLKALSAPLRLLKKQGAIESINDALIEIYKGKEPEIQEFRTFDQWKKEGKKILKGSKAFLVWGKPKTFKPENAEASKEEENEMEYFPICYLFSNLQVA